MCRFLKVFCTEYGEVRRCRDCGGIRLRAGSLLLMLEIEDLRWIDQTVRNISAEAPRGGLSEVEHTLLRFDAHGSALVVAREEIDALQVLLAGARFFLSLDGHWPLPSSDSAADRAPH